MDFSDILYNWGSLDKLLHAVNANVKSLQDDNLKAVANMLNGLDGMSRAKTYTQHTGKNAQAIRAIADAMNLDGSSNVSSQLRQVASIFDDMGIDLQARLQKVGNGVTLQLMPIPHGYPDFYTSGRGKELGIEPIQWTLPVDKSGHIVYDGLEKNNMLHAIADEAGNVKLLGAAEMALAKVLQQLTYQKNLDVLSHLKGGTDQQIRDASRRLKYVLNDMTRAAVSPGSNTSNMNASAMSDLSKMFDINGTPHRQDVAQSAVYYGETFNRLFRKHFSGQGSFAEQELKVGQATRLVQEMGLLMRSLGPIKGLEVIRRNKKFAPIMNSQTLALPVLRGLTQIAAFDTAAGPVADTHGLDISYLNGVQRAFEFLLPKASRKGYQTELVDQDYFVGKNKKAFTRGATWVTEYERNKHKGLGGKAYDTTRIIQLNQSELNKAIELRREYLNKKIAEAKKALENNQEVKGPSLTTLQKQLTELNNQALYSIENGGMLLSKQRAQELAASHVITKKLRRSDIYNTYIRNGGDKKDLTEQQKIDIAVKAVRETMRNTYRDAETYNSGSDIITYGNYKPPRGSKLQKWGKYEKELDNFARDFIANPDKYKDSTEKDVFGIAQKARLPLSKLGIMGKYVTPGGEVRAMSGIMDIESLLPFIAKVMGVKVDSLKGVQGIIERKGIESKNIIDYASGLMNDAFGKLVDSKYYSGRTTKQLEDFREKILGFLPKDLQDTVKNMMQIKGNDKFFTQTTNIKTQQKFKEFLPAILQAVGSATGWSEGGIKTSIGGQALTGLSAADIYYLMLGDQTYQGGNKIYNQAKSLIANRIGELQGKGGQLTTGEAKELENLLGIKIDSFADLKDLVKFSETNHPLSMIFGKHAAKEYGMPLSKGGMPVEYGYREFDSLNALISLSAALQHKDLSNLQEYYQTLRHRPNLSHQRYQGLVDYHNDARKLGDFASRVTEEDIKRRGGIIIDASRFDEAASNFDIYKEGGRDLGTNLLYEDFAKQSLLWDIHEQQVTAFKTIKDKQKRQELLEKAGGEEAVKREIRELKKTKEWKDKIEREIREEAEASLGASFIPYALYDKNVTAYDGGNGEWYSPYIMGTHLDWRRSVAADGRTVVNAGPNDSYILKVANGLERNIHSGALPADIAQEIGGYIRQMYEASWEELTEKDKSLFDQSVKTSLGHSFQGKVADITFANINNPEIQAQTKGAVVITKKMMKQLLNPNGEEKAAIDEGRLVFSDWLLAQYEEIMSKDAEELLPQIHADIAKELNNRNSSINKDIEKWRDSSYKPTVKNKERQTIIKSLKDTIKRNNRLQEYFAHGGTLSLEDSRVAEGLLQKSLRDNIVQAATIGTSLYKQSGGKGIISLLNRFPSLTGVNDVLAAKLLINPEWNNVEDKSLIGGDKALMDIMNADFDGDTINQVLLATGIDAYEAMLKLKGVDIDKYRSENGGKTYRKAYRDWIKGLSQEQRALYTQTKEMIGFDKFLGGMYGGNAEGMGVEDFKTNPDQEGRDLYLSKTGKAFTGMFSNIRQAFNNVLKNNNNNFDSSKERGLTLASEMFTNFLGIFEQAGISAKKLSAEDQFDWERKLSSVYEILNDPTMWNNGREGMYRVIEAAQRAGVLKDDDNLFDLSNPTSRRLFSPFLYKSIKFAQNNRGDKDFVNEIGRFLGINVGDKATLNGFRNFINSVEFDENGEIKNQEAVAKYLEENKLQVTKAGLGEVVDILSRAARQGKFQGVGPGGEKIKIENFGDILKNKKAAISAYRTYNYTDFFGNGTKKLDVNGLTDDDKDQIIKMGGVILDEKQGTFYLPPEAAAALQESVNEHTRREGYAALGESFFNAEQRSDLFNQVYKHNPEDPILDVPTKKTPTRILGKVIPYKHKGVTYRYEEQFNRLQSMIKGRNLPTAEQIFGNADEREAFFNSYKSMEGGNLSHEVAQSLLEILTGSDEDARNIVFNILTNKGLLRELNAENIDIIGKKLLDNKTTKGTYNKYYARPANEKDEDSGGIQTQIDNMKKVLGIFNPSGTDEAIGYNQDFINDLVAQGSGIAIDFLRSLDMGIVTTDSKGNTKLNLEKLKQLPILTEAALPGTFNRDKMYGRTDLMTAVLTKRNKFPYQNQVNTSAQDLTAILGDKAKFKTEYKTEDLESRENLLALIDRATSEKGWQLGSKQRSELLRIKKDLTPQEDLPVFKWRISDIKTALFGDTPSLTNVLQTVFYGQMADTIQHMVQNSDLYTKSGYGQSIKDAKKDLTYAQSLDLFGRVFDKGVDSEEKKAFEQFYEGFKKEGTDTYQLWQSLMAQNNKDESIVKEIIKTAAWTEGVELGLTKAPLFGEKVKSVSVDYEGLKRDKNAQALLGRIMSEENLSAFGIDSPLLERETEAAIMPYVTAETESGTIVKKSGKYKTKEGQKAKDAIFDYIKQALKSQKLLEKQNEGTLSDREAQILETTAENLGFSGKNFRDVVESIPYLTAAGQKELFDNLGLGEVYSKLKLTKGGKIDAANNDNLSAIQSALLQEGVKELHKEQREKGTGIKSWLKAKQENDKYQKEIDELRIKQAGYKEESEEYQHIGQQISALEDLQTLNAKTIKDQEEIHGAREKSKEEIEKIDGQIKELREQQKTYDKDSQEYKNLETNIQSLEASKFAQQETQAFANAQKKYQAQQALDKKLTTKETEQNLEEKYAQRTQLRQRESDIKAMLKNKDLTPEERFNLRKELNTIRDALDTQINNYIDAWEKEITESGDKESIRRMKQAKKVLNKPTDAILSGYTAQLGVISQHQAQEAKAFGVYSGEYGSQFKLNQLKDQLAHASILDPNQKRLLQIQIDEEEERLKAAQLEVKKYARESESNPNLAEVNKKQQEKAYLMYQNSLKASRSKAGAIDKVEGKIGGTIASLAKGYGLHRVLSRLIQTITKLIAQALNLDKIMANLRIVTGDSKDSTRALISEYANLGKAIGVTTTEIASSAVEWLRQGYETAEVLDLVKSSMYLSKLGMMDASTATQSLTSALKGFKLQASESMDVVDKLTAIDMKAATSAGEIAQGLAQFANLGSLAGVNIDQAAAYVATISDVTQMSGSSAGQALKTIISRYGNVKAGAYSKLNTDAESSDENTNLNDVERVLSKIGISIRRTNLEFKDFDEVLDAIAEKWNTLDRVSQKAVATAFAGIRQQEAFVTLLQNWGKYQDLLDVSENAKGTAEKKFTNAYQESYEAAKGKFTAALEDFMNKSEVNDLLTKIVKFGTKLVEYLPKLIKAMVNLFFSTQAIRSFTGKSLIAKGINGLLKSDFVTGFGALKENAPTNVGKGKTAWYYTKGVLGHLFGSIFGKRGEDDEEKATKKTVKGRIVSGIRKLLGIKDKSAESTVTQQSVTTTTTTTTTTQAGAQAQATAQQAQAATSNANAYNYTNSNNVVQSQQLNNAVASATKATSTSTAATGKAAAEKAASTKAGADGATGGTGGAVAQGVIAGISYGLNQLMAGLSAYEMIGQTHKNQSGKDVQSSDLARKKGGTIAATWTALLPFVGQYIGERHAQKVMSRIDAIKDTVNEMSTNASKIVSSLKEISGNISTLEDIADSDNFDINKMQDAIQAIGSSLYKAENDEAREQLVETRKQLQANLGGQTIYSLLEEYETGDEATRKAAARKLKLASMKTEHQNNAKVRRAEIYNQQNADLSFDNYINLQKAYSAIDSNIDKETGLTKEAKNRTYGVEYHGGSTAAKVVGKAAAGVGTGLLVAGPELISKGIGGFLVTAGAITDAIIGSVVWAKEQEAAIATEQQKMFNEWNSLSTFDREDTLKNQRKNVMAAIDDGTEGLGELLSQIETQLDSIKDLNGQILQNIKEANKEKIQEAILSTKTSGGKYLDELSKEEMKNLGESGLIKLVAKQVMEKGGLEGYKTFADTNNTEVSEYAKKMIETELSASNKTFQEVMSGRAYTLGETLRQAAKTPDDEYIQKRLQNFADAFGVTINELYDLSDTEKILKLSEALQSTKENFTSIENYGNLLSNITDGTKSATKWMADIVSEYPELIAYMSDTPALLEKINQKMLALVNLGFSSQLNEILSSDTFFETLKTQTKEDLGYSTIRSGIDELTDENLKKDIENLLVSSKASNLGDFYKELQGMDVTTAVSTLKSIVESVGDEYSVVSDTYLELLKNYTEVHSKELEKQLSNLEAQKNALQEINKQREYQNQLIDAQLKLENALNEKSRVYRAGVGFVYEANQDNILKAQKELEEVQQNKQISVLQQQTDILQSMKDQWDNMYTEKTYALQKQQAEAFEKYILKSDSGGFQNQMSNLAAASASTDGAVSKLSHLLAENFGDQETKKESYIQKAAEAYLEYTNTGSNDSLMRYQSALSSAQNYGGSIKQVTAAAKTLYEKNPSKYGNITNKINAAKSNGEEYSWSQGLEDAKAAELKPDNYSFTPYKIGDQWYRTLTSTESAISTDDILGYVWGDSKLSTAVDGKTAISAGDWGGFYAQDTKGNELFKVYVPNGNGYDAKTLTQFYTKKNKPELGADATPLYSNFVGWSQDEFYQKLQSQISGKYVILGGLHNDDEFVYLPKSGDPIPLKAAKSSQASWKQGQLVSVDSSQISQYYAGTLATNDTSVSMTNELGTEAIITPSGTITALPSRTGIVPADITKNLWALGEVAPAIMRLIGPSISPDHIGTTSTDVVDESFNINSLTMNVTADNSFDADAFVESIKTQANLTKNIRR